MIIGFVGNNRVGKDTSADFLIEIAKEKNIDFSRMALADPIKDIARLMFNFTENQLYGADKDIIDSRYNIKPRDFFQKFGTEIMQFDIYNYLPNLNIPKREFWVQLLINKIKNELIINPNKIIIITDIRGNHEAKCLVEQGGILIKIIKPTNSQNTHITEQEVEQIDNKFIKFTILNNSTLKNLKNQIHIIFNQIVTI